MITKWCFYCATYTWNKLEERTKTYLILVWFLPTTVVVIEWSMSGIIVVPNRHSYQLSSILEQFLRKSWFFFYLISAIKKLTLTCRYNLCDSEYFMAPNHKGWEDERKIRKTFFNSLVFHEIKVACCCCFSVLLDLKNT